MGKTLIKNAKIYDGSGEPAFWGDVLIEGERIVQLAASIPAESDFQVVDVNGLSLAPGFIDAHSHNDWFVLREESLKYSKDRACIGSLNPDTIGRDTTKVFLESLTAKSSEWSYEKEWRIIRDDGACGERWDAAKKGASLDMIRPVSVTLGCMAKQEFSKEVQEYCAKNRVNLYKMERDPKVYRLVKVPIMQFDD